MEVEPAIKRWKSEVVGDRLTHVDEAAGVVEGAEVRPRQGEHGVESGQQGSHGWPRQGRPDDQVPQRVTHEAETETDSHKPVGL